VRDKKGSTRP
jgi:hypothetical protein